MAETPSARSFTNPIGANQLLPAGTKHFTPTTARSNKVQDGALAFITNTLPVGSASAAHPAGRPTTSGSSTSSDD
jgi:hypothetical protein